MRAVGRMGVSVMEDERVPKTRRKARMERRRLSCQDGLVRPSG